MHESVYAHRTCSTSSCSMCESHIRHNQAAVSVCFQFWIRLSHTSSHANPYRICCACEPERHTQSDIDVRTHTRHFDSPLTLARCCFSNWATTTRDRFGRHCHRHTGHCQKYTAHLLPTPTRPKVQRAPTAHTVSTPTGHSHSLLHSAGAQAHARAHAHTLWCILLSAAKHECPR